MMMIALTLLLVALGFVLYRDRDFWFPETDEAALEDRPTERTRSAETPKNSVATKATSPIPGTKRRSSAPTSPQANESNPSSSAAAPPVAISRTVLPPLEVEVVAGDVHRTIRPGTNAVRVDLQPGSSEQAASNRSTASGTPEAADNLPSNAAEHVQMSTDSTAIVSRTVRPGYPLLARQMKVQGSVILQALISKDGDIQGLQVVSGPPILAGAAREAVRQWRFKPHYLGSETVETQAKITVNFTISTN